MFSISQKLLLKYQFSTVKRSKAFMDISIDGQLPGRLVIQLFDDLVPKTVENFKKLCEGTVNSKTSGHPLYYKEKKFFRILPGFMCQAGDVINNDGSGGESIYGPNFPNENFKVSLSSPGMLGMLNKGENTAHSTFFITHIDCSFLDGKYVGFGQVTDGLAILNQIEYCGELKTGKPKKEVIIKDCGLIIEKKS